MSSHPRAIASTPSWSWGSLTPQERAAVFEYLPFNPPGATADPATPWRLHERHFTPAVIAQDRLRFSRWLRAMGGKRLHLLTQRFHANLRSTASSPSITPLDCPAVLSLEQEETIWSNIARVAAVSPEGQCDCYARTERMRGDIESCLLAWASRCSTPLVTPLRRYFTQLFATAQWQGLAGTAGDASGSIRSRDNWTQESVGHSLQSALRRRDNVGSHMACSEMMNTEDQAFVWEKEKTLATRAGYTRWLRLVVMRWGH